MAVDILLSYAYHAKTDLSLIRSALGPNQKLMIDSGAFTAYTLGKPIQLTEYAEFLNRWRGVYDYAITLDVIGNPKETANNLRFLEKKQLSVLPVYTATAHLRELKALAKDYDYLAFGGVVGVPKHLRVPATKRVVEEAQNSGAKVHTLGQASIDMFKKTGAYSGDSSSASQMPKYASLPIYNPRSHSFISCVLGDKRLWQKYADLFYSYGLPAQACLTGDIIRDRKKRIVGYRAGILAVAAMSADLRQEKDTPRAYSAITHPTEGPAAIYIAATDWRTANLPSPLRQLAERSNEALCL